MSHPNLFVIVAATAMVVGCSEQPRGSASGKPLTTQEIGEYDPTAGKEVVSLETKVTDPLTGPLEILKKVRVTVPTLQIEHALNLYNATEGRFPQTHEEFMTNIIVANRIALPQLPSDLAWQYDIQSHKLVIVRTADGKIVE